MSLRKIIFWTHLIAGVISGLVIGVMCFTGAALAFEKELAAWSERDARRIEPPAGAPVRLPLDELQARVRAKHPGVNSATIVILNDPRAAVAFTAGRTAGIYVNPYTGEVRRPRSNAMARWMQTFVEWHRYLGLSGEVSRPRGKLINGICNIAFCVLAITGLYLWVPRSWSWRSVRGIAVFNRQLQGHARDFNWHNVIGLWTAPILIVLTITAMPISFRWATNAIFTLTGTEPPPAGGTARAPGGETARPPGATRLSQEALLAVAQKEILAWTSITLRPDPAGPATAGSAHGGTARSHGDHGGRTVTLTVRTAEAWPKTATTTLELNPYTGEIVRRTGYAEQDRAQKVRSWTRFLHTGEALGWVGQLLAGLACVGGCVLVWTGLALAWRRFF